MSSPILICGHDFPPRNLLIRHLLICHIFFNPYYFFFSFKNQKTFLIIFFYFSKKGFQALVSTLRFGLFVL